MPRLAPVTTATFPASAALMCPPFLECGVERAVARIELVVGGGPGGVGSTTSCDPHTTGDRVRDVGEDTARDAAEQRCAVCRALLGRRRLHGHAEYRGDDPTPEPAARASTGDPGRAGIDAQIPQQLERVPQPERDAFEDGAHEGSAVVAKLKAHERAAGVGIRMRRALSGEVGQEEQTVRAGIPALRLADELSECRTRRSHVAEPLQRAGGRQHHAHHVPGPRHSVAERMHARPRIRGEGGQRGEHDARRTEHDRERARPVDPDAERRGRAVSCACCHRDPPGVRPETSGDSSSGGSQRAAPRERRAPRPTSTARQRRAGASRTRPRRPSPTRP